MGCENMKNTKKYVCYNNKCGSQGYPVTAREISKHRRFCIAGDKAKSCSIRKKSR